MWINALLMSVVMLPIWGRMLFSVIKTLPSYHDNTVIGVFLLSVVSVLMLVWCDVALAVDAAGLKHSAGAGTQLSRSRLDWVVRIAALILSAYYLSLSILGVRAYRLHGDLDMLVTGVMLTCVVLLFDVALVVHAIESRTRRAE